MKCLKVPYVSQIMDGALQHNNDCGAACAVMMLRAYGVALETSVDKFYDQIIPSGDISLTAGSIQANMRRYGLPCTWKGGLTPAQVFEYLLDDKPMMALIHYDPLVIAGLTQKSGFRGAHFVVVVSIDIASVGIRDPYRNDGIELVEVPHKVWDLAWTETQVDGNPQFCALVPDISIQDIGTEVPPEPEGVKYTVVANGFNVRSGPSTAYPVLRILWRSLTPFVHVKETIGVYGKLSDGSGWIYIGKSPVLVKLAP